VPKLAHRPLQTPHSPLRPANLTAGKASQQLKLTDVTVSGAGEAARLSDSRLGTSWTVDQKPTVHLHVDSTMCLLQILYQGMLPASGTSPCRECRSFAGQTRVNDPPTFPTKEVRSGSVTIVPDPRSNCAENAGSIDNVGNVDIQGPALYF
jgi:hypothetical protein